jgi:hypothetical protein
MRSPSGELPDATPPRSRFNVRLRNWKQTWWNNYESWHR